MTVDSEQSNNLNMITLDQKFGKIAKIIKKYDGCKADFDIKRVLEEIIDIIST